MKPSLSECKQINALFYAISFAMKDVSKAPKILGIPIRTAEVMNTLTHGDERHKTMETDDLKILNVGLACLDIVMRVKSYPEEDSDQRCESSQWRRGGNASNNCSLMKEFGVPCEYYGTMSKDLGGRFLKENFEASGIACSNCVFYEDCECPTSVVLCNIQNGSRTIVHSNKNLPELCFDDFKKLDLSKYKWIHFEGRPNLPEVAKMINSINEFNNSHVSDLHISISIELEKPKAEFVDCIGYEVDVVFISKDLARFCNCNTMQLAITMLSQKLHPKSVLICPWGENGACARSLNGSLAESPAYPPYRVVDTLGAGDTFVAATVMNLANGKPLQASMTTGCIVAGAKCGIEGIAGLHQLFPLINE